MKNIFAYYRPVERRFAGVLAGASVLIIAIYLLACLFEFLGWLGVCRIPVVFWVYAIKVFLCLFAGQIVLACGAILFPLRYVVLRQWATSLRACEAAWTTIGVVLIMQIAVYGGTALFFDSFCMKEGEYQEEMQFRAEQRRWQENNQGECDGM